MNFRPILPLALAVFACAATSLAGDRLRRTDDRAPSSRRRQGETYTWAIFRGDHHDDVDGLGFGFFPMHRNVTGAEIGLVGEVLDGDLRGFGWGTICSVVQGELHGGQFAFLTSIADKPSSGFQVSGIVSSAAEFSGFQFAVLHNNADAMSGLQLSALANIVDGDFSGIQFAALNRAGNVHGLQLGLFNFATGLRGAQVGLSNYVKDSMIPWTPLLHVSF